MGYRRIQGELVGLGIKLAASTAWTILKEAGIEPAPKRLEANRSEFLRQQAGSIRECDFLTVTRLPERSSAVDEEARGSVTTQLPVTSPRPTT